MEKSVTQRTIDAIMLEASNNAYEKAALELEKEQLEYELYGECWSTVQDCIERIRALKEIPLET